MLNSASATAASSSAAAAAVDDYDSDGKAEPEESDDLVVSSDDDDNNVNNDVDEDIFFAAWDIQNRMSRNAGTAAMEHRRFRELFGASIDIVLQVWHMMDDGGFLPEKTKPKHLLWTLYFMKVYPQEAPTCSTVGGSGGAFDPKTPRKWVWLIMERIAKLVNDVVSNIFCQRSHRPSSSHPPPSPPHRCLQKQARHPRRRQQLPHVD
jgi:hypothetical protein